MPQRKGFRMKIWARWVVLPLVGLVANAGVAIGFDHSHALWGSVLSQFVVDGRVRYAALKKESDPLHRYLDAIGAVSEDEFSKFSVNQRKAFLLNVYNASVVSLALHHYPLSSIKEIGIKYVGPWKLRFIPLLGKKVSLDEIEHTILRKKLFDPRIHFALVSASKGSPRMYPSPFKDDLLDAQLDDAATRFMNDPDANRLDLPGKTLYLSELFRWFSDDFERAYGSVWNAVRRYMTSAAAVPTGLELTISYIPYDWSLNE